MERNIVKKNLYKLYRLILIVADCGLEPPHWFMRPVCKPFTPYCYLNANI